MRLTELLVEFKKVMYVGENERYFIMSGMTNTNGERYWIKGDGFDNCDTPNTIKYSTISDARVAAEKQLRGLTQ